MGIQNAAVTKLMKIGGFQKYKFIVLAKRAPELQLVKVGVNLPWPGFEPTTPA